MGLDKCSKCGVTGGLIHMHHLNPEYKSFEIAVFMVQHCQSKENMTKFVSELNKCIPVCPACHNALHT